MSLLLETKNLHADCSASSPTIGNRFRNGVSIKKGLLSALFILAVCCSCFAQDIIVTKDSRKIRVFFDNGSFVIGIHDETGMTETNGKKFKVTGAKAHNSNISITIGCLF